MKKNETAYKYRRKKGLIVCLIALIMLCFIQFLQLIIPTNKIVYILSIIPLLISIYPMSIFLDIDTKKLFKEIFAGIFFVGTFIFVDILIIAQTISNTPLFIISGACVFYGLIRYHVATSKKFVFYGLFCLFIAFANTILIKLLTH